MLAITYHQSCPKGTPWGDRMSDLPEATAKAKEMLAQHVCPSTVLSTLEAHGYSFYVAQVALARAITHHHNERS